MENKTITSNGSTVVSRQYNVASTDEEKKIRELRPGSIFGSNVIIILLIALVTPVTLYYLWTRGFIYLNFTREVYTDYFWSRAPWLLIHVLSGIAATLLGPFQFIAAIRKKWPAVHRGIGKTYMICIVISTIVSFYLINNTNFGGIVYLAGLTGLGVVWLVTTFMAYLSIRAKDIQSHKAWMIKSYVLTVSFVCFRFVEDLMTMFDIGSFTERKVLMSWACWAVPFFITEVVLQAKRLQSKKYQSSKGLGYGNF